MGREIVSVIAPASVKALEFLDSDGYLTQAYAAKRPEGVGYCWRLKVVMETNSAGEPYMQPGKWYFVPRARMASHGGIHASALEWLNGQMDLIEEEQ